MIVTYLEREKISLSIEVLPATQREIFIKLKANVVVLVNVLQLKLGIIQAMQPCTDFKS